MNKKKLTLLWTVLAISSFGEESINLEKSVIYSTNGFATEMRKISSNPTLVTAEDIEKKNYSSVEEILADIPSINIVRQGKDYIIDLRGQGEKAKQNVQILVDGVQMNSLDTSMSATPINTISPDDIERIEVIPGGGSVLYGSGTSGGVVNIITKKGKGRTLNVGYEYGSFANKKTNIAVGESFGKFDVNLSYTNHKRDGYRDYDESDSDSFMGNIRYRISDTQDINFKYSKYKAEEKYPTTLNREQVEEDRKQSGMAEGEWSTTDTDKDEYTVTYNNKLTSNLDFNLIGFWQKTTMDIDSRSITTGFMGAMPYTITMDQNAEFEDEKWGFKPKFKYSYGEENSLVFGMDYIKNKATRFSKTYGIASFMPKPMANTITTNDLEKETISGFLMNNYVWNSFEFSQGIRYEKANYDIGRGTTRADGNNDTPISVDNSEDNFAYELGVNWLYSDTGKTYIRYEKGFTSPPPALLTNKEVSGEYKLNDLESETYDNIEIGMSDYLGFTSINTSIFYTVTKDEITSDMDNDMPPAWIKNYNLGKTERYGFEISTNQYFGNLTLSQSWAYIHTEIKDGKDGDIDISGNRVANVPEHKFNLGADYAFTPKFTVGGEVVYTDSVYLNNQNLGGKVNSHTVTNIRARYSFDNGLDIYAGINNLFDREYYETVSYSNGEYSYDPASERNYYVGFKYSL